MSTVAQLVADQVKADNPTFGVTGFPSSPPENIARGKTLVQVYRQSFEPTINGTHLAHTLEIVVFVAAQGTEKAELDLEASLDKVMLSLERFAGLTYSNVVRSVVGNLNAYVITATTNTTNHYKSLVRAEQKAV